VCRSAIPFQKQQGISMKRLLCITLLLSLNAVAGTQIITDFDDTIKRSNIPNHGTRTVLNVPLFKKAYTGMPALLQEMEQNSNGLYVISASPNLIRSMIKLTMYAYRIPYNEIFTRDLCEIFSNSVCDAILSGKESLSSEELKIKYKVDKIEGVINDNPNDELILLGDNVEADHKVYLKVSDKNPGKVTQIYIRKVKDEVLPKSVTGFYTAFEVAATEYSKERLTYGQVEDIAKDVLKAKSMYRLIPNYAHCPTKREQFTPVLSEELKPLEIKVQNKVIEYCKKRQK
jgi:phosphatidate phosphatase APP1